eukprot:TRINITY_DN21084_c0_g1_i1.p1 TRINITY_DN21084_c0_g1~~TRINITY_DN21084_c0_g1_i1.p1  ORF type:complete len:552 (+),score=215.42 TRINITY_DN21084_c0_g1_i1:45-1700(+)
MSYIAELLSQSIAKLSSPSGKRKLEVEELEETVAVKKEKKSPRKVKFDVPESSEVELGDPKVKKKKKKKDKSRDQDVLVEEKNPDKENAEIDAPESEVHTKLKKKKKKHDRSREEDEEAFTLNEDLEKKKKKKKHKRKSEDEVSLDQEENILRESETVNEGDSNKSLKKKKKKIKTKGNTSGELEKNPLASQLEEILEGTPSTTRNRTLIQDIYCAPDFSMVREELYKVVMYILKENISISKLNIIWTKNCLPLKEEKDYLTKMHNAIFYFFTEEEDMKIRQRLKYLVDNKIITNLKVFLSELNEKNGHSHFARREKATRPIIGLYVGQDLPNRTAYCVTQRLIFLMTGSSMVNDYNTKKKMVVKTEGPVYKTKQKPRYWSLNEDEILIEKVLQSKNGSGHVAVEALKESEVDWDEVAKSLVEYGRTRQLVRERWNRTVKVLLLEGEQDPQEKFEYQKYLLEYVIKMGVKDKKEIRWKEVAPAFAPKTSAVLSQDFWSLVKGRKETTLAGKLETALIGLEKPTGKAVAQNNKKGELRSQLLDFYGSLAKNS